MDHAGANTGGSRFAFVLDRDAGASRDGTHTVFGMTEQELDVLRAIEPGDELVRVRVWE